MTTKSILITLGIVFLVTGGMYTLSASNKDIDEKNTQTLNEFATCIKDSGAKFYGAFWCSHCQNQKKMFGDAKDSLPYIECSTPDNKQTDECKNAKIEGYPTWEFSDGSRLSGEQSFETLSEKTSCSLPVLSE